MGDINSFVCIAAVLFLLMQTGYGDELSFPGQSINMSEGAYGRFLAGCEPVSAAVLASANLTEPELEALGDICWRPAEMEAFVSRPSMDRHGIPSGVNCSETGWCDSGGYCSAVCGRGSVVVDPWLRNAIQLQIRLARRLPLCQVQLLGTHNSAITLADGYGNLDEFFEGYLKWITWAGQTNIRTNNQWLSLTDQLNLGVRNIELDTHYVQGALRIAHCGGAHLPVLNRLLAAMNLLAKLLRHHVRWDTETFGCDPSLSSIPAKDQRTFSDALQEISAWLHAPGNEDEFLILFLDDQMDLLDWGLVDQLKEEIKLVFPVEQIYTPPERREQWGPWPSIDELAASGKRVMFVSGADYGEKMEDVIFSRSHVVCDWTEPSLDVVKKWPDCGIQYRNGTQNKFMQGRLFRTLSCELTYGPMNCDFVFHAINSPVLNERNLAGVVQCGLNIPCPDLLTPARAAAGVWSWALEQPFAGPPPQAYAPSMPLKPGLGGWLKHVASEWLQGRGVRDDDEEALCAAAAAFDGGRWYAWHCSAGLPSACRDTSSGAWRLGSGGLGICPGGTRFALPLHGRDNMKLLKVLQAARQQAAFLPLTGPDWTLPTAIAVE